MKLVKTSGNGEIGFNMTPAISVIFNLLMFFVLTAQFSALEMEDVNLPVSVTAEPKEYGETQSIFINIVHPDAPVVMVGGKEVSDADLTEMLKDRSRKAKDLNETLIVILRADENVAYADIARVMLAAGRAEIPGWWIEADISKAGSDEMKGAGVK
jgi:biopolymer transport protein ExbD